MKEYIKVLSIGFVFFYLCYSFINVEIDFTNWHIETRRTYIILSIFISTIMFAVKKMIEENVE
jgi:hypothetical protein